MSDGIKNSNMKTLSTICVLILFLACSENKLSKVDFMVGTWKLEGKEQYEVWESNNNNELKGYVYRYKDSQKIITETLAIKMSDNTLIYEATVPDQNEGRTIPFTLNNEIKDRLSFENMNHDFPKKIQYKRLSENEIEVTVLGDEDKGFSYKQLKHDE